MKRFPFVVMSGLFAAIEEFSRIVSWRSQWLCGQWASWYAVVQRRAWDFRISLEMLRESSSGIDNYRRKVNALHRKLGVPADYLQRGMTFQREASDLVGVPCGLEGELRWMTPATRLQWLALQAAASSDGIILLVRDAFRSADDQAHLIREQLCRGEEIEQILTGIAAPGYSQHHTGQALDIECIPAGNDFETTPAFNWLCRNGAEYGFELSYPRGNPFGIMYEPWHWYCNIEKVSLRAPTEPV